LIVGHPATSHVKIKADATGLYVCLTGVHQAVPAGNKITGISCSDYPDGFERRPPAQEAPSLANFYFKNPPKDKFPRSAWIKIEYRKPLDGLYGAQLPVELDQEMSIPIQVAPWINPTAHEPFVLDLDTADTFQLVKQDVCKALGVDEIEAATLWIGPRDTAVPMVTIYDCLMIKPGDLILVKTPGPSQAVNLPVIKWTDLKSVSANPIGSGAFSDVYKAEYWSAEVAVKRFRGVSDDPKTREAFRAEAELLSQLLHPSICRILAIIEEPLALVLEYAPNGSLYHALHDLKKQYSVRAKLDIALDIATGLQYLHGKKPAHLHRDLKSANVLLTDSNHAKLADFGISRSISANNTMTANVGTTQWCGMQKSRSFRDRSRKLFLNLP
jgi:hypothetical protein